MLRLATFNVFWFGTHETFRVARTPRDEEDLASVIRRVDADVLVLQEIVDVTRLEWLLAAGPRPYRLRDAQGRFLTTGAMRSRRSHIQKLVLAYDESTVSLDAWLDPFGSAWPGPRRPVVARFTHRASGLPFTIVGVHLKSGDTVEDPGSHEFRTRRAEASALARWLSGHGADEAASDTLPGVAPPDAARPIRPPTAVAILLGDLNAVRDHPSLDPLRDDLPAWTWHTPRFPDDPAERWTAFSERTVIDHVLTSPATTPAVVEPPEAHAFDLDPGLDREPREPVHFLRRRTDLVIVPGEDEPPILVENLVRISDHRPLVLVLDPARALAAESAPGEGPSP